MATTNYSWALPVPDASENTWGAIINAAFESVDGQVFTLAESIPDVSGLAPKASPTFTGTVTGPTFVGDLTGNATSATRLVTSRTISLGGILSGGIAFNGTADVTISAAIADGTLSIAKTSGLQTALNAKEPTLAETQKRVITYGTAAVGGTLAEGSIYLQYEA